MCLRVAVVSCFANRLFMSLFFLFHQVFGPLFLYILECFLYWDINSLSAVYVTSISSWCAKYFVV